MKTLIAALLACSISAAHAVPQSGGSDLSGASALVAEGSGVVVAGSLVTLMIGGSVVVLGVEAIGDGIEVVLKSAVDGSRATVRLSGAAAKQVALSAGTAVNVVAVSTGHMLVASGKVLAFIPNEAGKALLHHSAAGAGK